MIPTAGTTDVWPCLVYPGGRKNSGRMARVLRLLKEGHIRGYIFA